MRSVDIIVDNWLRVDCNYLGHDLTEQILDKLTVINQARVKAEQQGRTWQAKQMVKEWLLARFYDREIDGEDPEFNGDWLFMARGFALELKLFLRDQGIKVRWVDRRHWEVGDPYGFDEFSYREHQAPVVVSIRHNQQGMYRAPTGSGKTATICGLLWETHPQFALIVVDRTPLLHQWVKALQDRMGLAADDIGTIGEGKWSTGRVTVATVQSVSRKWDEPRVQSLLRRQSVIVLDECHHATADTYRRVLDSSTARYRLGVSATPDKTGEFDLARLTLGPIFYTDDDEELREAGVLMKPHVEVVHTPFNKPFWGDHRAQRDKRTGEVEECEVPGCRKSGKVPHGHRNNYQQIKSQLIADRERNEIIANKIRENLGRCQVVISNEINQLDAIWKTLHDLGVKYPYYYTLTGKTKAKDKREIFEQLEVVPGFVLFSTIAGEGLDVPRIDTIHLPFPTKNGKKREQEIGRGTRIWEGKTDIVAIDYADVLNDALRSQFRSRLANCYQPLGLEVEVNEEFAQSLPNGGGLGRGIL